MKLYKVYMCLELVMGRIAKYKLYEFNSVDPIIFVTADDPDGACFRACAKLANVIIKQRKKNKATLKFIKEVLDDIKIKRIREANETKL